jgi:hypothetical protein
MKGCGFCCENVFQRSIRSRSRYSYQLRQCGRNQQKMLEITIELSI